ncbi:hypothetical protein V5F49_02380 [Xanthobacter sp. V3C-3]|uniref:hypothetical protein n=1 Tax=Xanthobacter lutulentifluminis TaxID=3119935 RepID=UPI00372AEFA6
MGHHTTGAIVLAATLLAASVAFAADEPSRRDADAEAEAGMSATYYYTQQRLGYVATPDRTHPAFERLREYPVEPVRREDPDRMFLEQGDRGLGND